MLACEAGTVKSSAPIPGELAASATELLPGRLLFQNYQVSWGGPKNFGIYNASRSAHPVVLDTGVRKLYGEHYASTTN